MSDSLILVEACPGCGAPHTAWQGHFDAIFAGARGETSVLDVPGMLCGSCKNLFVEPRYIATIEIAAGAPLRCRSAIASDRYLQRPAA